MPTISYEVLEPGCILAGQTHSLPVRVRCCLAGPAGDEAAKRISILITAAYPGLCVQSVPGEAPHDVSITVEDAVPVAANGNARKRR